MIFKQQTSCGINKDDRKVSFFDSQQSQCSSTAQSQPRHALRGRVGDICHVLAENLDSLSAIFPI